ncbi:UNVERIFIED_CONTAM: hypothetical protein HDU68_000641 [Siphonaria sp. JEL0065]|nr:hypothetical protein HDU68_000641 [Siphonaria sp. JEL0065]
MLIEIDKKLFSDRPYMVAGGPYTMRTSRFRRGGSGGGGENVGMAGTTAPFSLPASGASRGHQAKPLTKHKRKKKMNNSSSANGDSGSASSLPSIRKNNFVVGATASQTETRQSETARQGKVPDSKQEAANEEEENEEEDEFSDFGSSDSFLLSATEIEVAEKDIPEILLAIDLEQENQRIQEELSHTREASAISQAQNASFLESNLTNLVENVEEYSLTSQLTNQQMEMQTQTAQHIMEEAIRGGEQTEQLLKLVEGDLYEDMWRNLDTIVQRTMPNVFLNPYAFHEELLTLSDLRSRENDLESEYLRTKTNFRISESDLRLVEDELELMTINMQKIEKSIADIFTELTTLTSQLATKHILPTHLLHQIHNVISTSLVPYCDHVISHLQQLQPPPPSPAADSTISPPIAPPPLPPQPESLLLDAQSASLNFATVLKISGPNLLNIAKQSPVINMGNLVGAVSHSSIASGVEKPTTQQQQQQQQTANESLFSLVGSIDEKGGGGGRHGSIVAGSGVKMRASTVAATRMATIRASITKRISTSYGTGGKVDSETSEEGSIGSKKGGIATKLGSVVQKAILHNQIKEGNSNGSGSSEESGGQDDRRGSLLLRRPSLKIAASLVIDDARRKSIDELRPLDRHSVSRK